MAEAATGPTVGEIGGSSATGMSISQTEEEAATANAGSTGSSAATAMAPGHRGYSSQVVPIPVPVTHGESSQGDNV